MQSSSPFTFKTQTRELIVPGNKEETLNYCLEHFIQTGRHAIADHDFFTVALSGGSTPLALFNLLALPENASRLDWAKIYLFWGDERSVPPTDPKSNYGNAMASGLKTLAIPSENIFRMRAEEDIARHAISYGKLIESKVPNLEFDLLTLGMGEDGHTASLFPGTEALNNQEDLVVANTVPQLDCTRMTFTYKLINNAKEICFYVIGDGKAERLHEVFHEDACKLPSAQVGTEASPAHWIADTAAAKTLLP
jgi:6-phosphogluconolactonase